MQTYRPKGIRRLQYEGCPKSYIYLVFNKLMNTFFTNFADV